MSIKWMIKLIRMSNLFFPCIGCIWEIITEYFVPGSGYTMINNPITQGIEGVYEVAKKISFLPSYLQIFVIKKTSNIVAFSV